MIKTHSSQYPTIGLLGGTFDPVHNGHLLIATESQKKLKLDELYFIPCKANSLKPSFPRASLGQRLTMLYLATRHQPRLQVDDRELCRDGESYTIDTLNEIRQEFHRGGKIVSLCLLLASDVFMQLYAWHRWREILNVAHIVILPRPGLPYYLHPCLQLLIEKYQITNSAYLQNSLAGHLYILEIDHQNIISASTIRSAIQRGDGVSQYLPDTVWRYIQQHRLYSG